MRRDGILNTSGDVRIVITSFLTISQEACWFIGKICARLAAGGAEVAMKLSAVNKDKDLPDCFNLIKNIIFAYLECIIYLLRLSQRKMNASRNSITGLVFVMEMLRFL
jgi:hypothetical protein